MCTGGWSWRHVTLVGSPVRRVPRAGWCPLPATA